MKILVVCRHLPLPTWGAGTRNHYLLRALARAHDVTLLALTDAADPAGHAVRPLAALVRRLRVVRLSAPTPMGKRLGQARALLTGQSYLLAADASALVQSALDDLLRRQPFDAVLFESALLAGYRVPAGVHTIIDQHNIEHELLWRSYVQARGPLRRAYNWWEYRRFMPYELSRCRRAALVLVTSERERVMLQRLLPATRIRVVPNGVDPRAYDGALASAHDADNAEASGLVGAPGLAPATTELTEHAGRVVFSAALDYYPNIQAALHFAHHCWPLIRACEPHATWQIVGRNPPPAIWRLAHLPGVSVTGTVPATQPYLAACAVAIAPVLTGGGTRLKILEALAMRKAVVSTTIGCEGLAVVSGEHLVVADEPRAFARAVVDLLRDPGRRAALGAAGRALIAERYSWDICGAALIEAIAALEGAG